MQRRFVIQKHSGWGPTHFDLMIEDADTLATWQFAADPWTSPEATLPCRRIADHRRAYLDYQGPVSGGRGRVDIVSAGRVELAHCDGQRWRGVAQGRGGFVLAQVRGDQWQWSWQDS